MKPKLIPVDKIETYRDTKKHIEFLRNSIYKFKNYNRNCKYMLCTNRPTGIVGRYHGDDCGHDHYVSGVGDFPIPPEIVAMLFENWVRITEIELADKKKLLEEMEQDMENDWC